MRVGSLFAGIGGFDLAARWMGWETAWFSEIDPYASAVLQKHWPGVPNLGDITKIEWAGIPRVDLLCGGFPCQDISNANPRAVGISGERSGLWREYARAVRELRPRWVIVENVPALLNRGYDVVRGDLRAAGYRVARPVVMSASAVGARHLRARLWVVAHSLGVRKLQPQGSQPHIRGWPSHGGLEVADAGRQGLPGPQQEVVQGAGWRHEGGAVAQCGWWSTEPDVGRVAHGIPRRVDRLRCLGNAIVPQCAFEIFQAIAAREAQVRVA